MRTALTDGVDLLSGFREIMVSSRFHDCLVGFLRGDDSVVLAPFQEQHESMQNNDNTSQSVPSTSILPQRHHVSGNGGGVSSYGQGVRSAFSVDVDFDTSALLTAVFGGLPALLATGTGGFFAVHVAMAMSLLSSQEGCSSGTRGRRRLVGLPTGTKPS